MEGLRAIYGWSLVAFLGVLIIFQQWWRSTFNPKKGIHNYLSSNERRECDRVHKGLLINVASLFWFQLFEKTFEVSAKSTGKAWGEHWERKDKILWLFLVLFVKNSTGHDCKPWLELPWGKLSYNIELIGIWVIISINSLFTILLAFMSLGKGLNVFIV